jgi:hypothetical protein
MNGDVCVVSIFSEWIRVSTASGEKIFTPPPGEW